MVQYLVDSNVANMDPTPALTLRTFGKMRDAAAEKMAFFTSAILVTWRPPPTCRSRSPS